MQNYIDVKTEKEKAIFNLFKKYWFILVSTFISIFFTISDGFDVMKATDIFEGMFVYNMYIIKGIILLFFIGLSFYSAWGVFYFFKRDYALVSALLKDKFELKVDYVDSMRINNVNLGSSERKKLILKRYKIYFRDTNKTYNDSYYTTLKTGDKVYLWLSTNPNKYQRILHVSKIG